VSGKPGAGQKTAPKPGTKGPAKGPQNGTAPQGGKGAGGKGGQRPPRPGTRPAAGPRRGRTALWIWGSVALVVVVVVVLVVIKVTSGGSGTGTTPAAGPVPASVTHDVTNIPTSVYNTVGVTSPTVPVNPPTVVGGGSGGKTPPPLTYDGKPGVFFLGGEFCPYCAAERWSIIASLSRFGTFSGLQTMQSSSTDVAPNTPTFTFANAKLTSPYVAVNLHELYGNQRNSAGTGWVVLKPLNKTEQALVKKYDKGDTATSSGSIPFMDIGNKLVTQGASYSPTILQGLTRQQIAANLSDPSNPATKAIIASSNYISAGVCAINGGKPATVCTSKGVTAATKALNLGS